MVQRTRSQHGDATIDFLSRQSNPKDPDQLFLSAAPNQKRSLQYLGIDGQFFAAAILPHPEQPDGLSDIQQAATALLASPSSVEPKQMAANVSAWFDTSVATIEPNQEWSKQYTLFAAPKILRSWTSMDSDRFSNTAGSDGLPNR